MNYSTIKTLMLENKVTVRRMCKEIGVTESGFWKMLKNGSVKTSTLEKIAQVLEIPVTYFFEDAQQISKPPSQIQGHYNQVANGNNVKQHLSIGEYESEIIYLKEKIGDLKEIIKLKDEIISELRSKIERL